jgi:hypothetical protein
MSERVSAAECPFCPTNGTIIEGTARKGYHVTCRSCCAQGPVSSTKEEALAGWNGRFVPKFTTKGNSQHGSDKGTEE